MIANGKKIMFAKLTRKSEFAKIKYIFIYFQFDG